MRLTTAYLRETFRYHAGTLLYRIFGAPLIGSNTLRVSINGTRYNLRDLVWIYHYGPIPAGSRVIHLDEDSKDAYIESLRLEAKDGISPP